MSNRPNAVLSWLLLAAAFAAALKAADRVPSLVAGTPHGARVYRTVAEAERAMGVRLWLPRFVPPSVDWPPFRVDCWAGPPPSVALRASGRQGAGERLVIVQSIGAPASPPSALLEPLEPLVVVDVAVGEHAAVLTRGIEPGGRVLHDLSWDAGDRRLTIRYTGPVEQLLRLAASLERTHP
jgi:hypothetical protein